MSAPAGPKVKRPCNAIVTHCFNGDMTLCAICPGNNKVVIYDTKSWKQKAVLDEHTSIVTAIEWHHPSNRILTTGEDRNAYVWTLEGGVWKPVLVLLRINRSATCCSWTEDGSKFAVGSGDKILSICHFDEKHNWWGARHIKKHKSTILSCEWNPDGLTIMTTCADFKTRIWSGYLKKVDTEAENPVKFGTLIAEVESSKGWLHDCSWSPDGDTFAYTGHDSTVTVGRLSDLEHPQRVKLRYLPMTCIQFIDESTIMVAGHDGKPGLIVLKDDKWVWKCFLDAGKKPGIDHDNALQSLHQGCIFSLKVNRKSGKISTVSTSCVGGCVVRWPIGMIKKKANATATR